MFGSFSAVQLEGSSPIPDPSAIWRRSSAGACKNLTDPKILPGWEKINEYAKTHWGNKRHKVVTNDKDFPQFPALVCTPTTQPIQMSYSGEPLCTTNNVTSAGVLSGTSGTVSVSVGQGFMVSSTFALSSSTSFDLSDGLTPMINFPDVAGIMQGFSTNAMISNTRSESLTKTYNDMQTTTLIMASLEGQKCDATVEIRTCLLQGTGVLRMVGEGFVWFQYEDKVKDRVDIKEIVPDLEERTTTITFQGPIKVETHAAYAGSCQGP
ncbi:hypothetical protein F5050DRAFT_1716128 [Lentinula boryana]|uniref:Acid protease n=1 Tax=Lentinula boryana TaxID=40481 RepID=A0ABQ8Q0N7_9AGAR|nr:hypothetical protein F5050DRAFT_1716128 [Lentinula boryana]